MGRLLRFGLWLVPMILAAQSSDVRIVAGRSVDLAPLHEWLATREGDRPLSHWKVLQVREIKKIAGGYDQCLIRSESGATRELLVANLPASVRMFFQSIRQKRTAVETYRNALAAAKAEEQRLGDQYLGTYLGDYVSTTSQSSGTTHVDSEQGRRTRYRNSQAQVKNLEERLEAATAEYENAVNSATSQTSVIAMNVGRKFANLEVWDCGRKK